MIVTKLVPKFFHKQNNWPACHYFLISGILAKLAITQRGKPKQCRKTTREIHH